jgi:hypothetical protein
MNKLEGLKEALRRIWIACFLANESLAFSNFVYDNGISKKEQPTECYVGYSSLNANENICVHR